MRLSFVFHLDDSVADWRTAWALSQSALSPFHSPDCALEGKYELTRATRPLIVSRLRWAGHCLNPQTEVQPHVPRSKRRTADFGLILSHLASVNIHAYTEPHGSL
jgi:hypothetical protein